MKKCLSLITLVVLTCSTASAFYFDDDYDGIQQGYRGFADFSYTLSVGHGNSRVGIMTSHGYQIAPQLFAGVGVGFNYFFSANDCGLPVFAHFRSDILDNEITPYVDLRVGYSLLDIEGFYLNPSVGCRFEVSDNLGLNVSIGYTMQQFKYHSFQSERVNLRGIDFRFGIDF